MTNAIRNWWRRWIGVGVRMPQPGEWFWFYPSDPFVQPRRCVVTDTRDGYVQYQWENGDRRHSMDVGAFVRLVTPERLQEEGDG